MFFNMSLQLSKIMIPCNRGQKINKYIKFSWELPCVKDYIPFEDVFLFLKEKHSLVSAIKGRYHYCFSLFLNEFWFFFSIGIPLNSFHYMFLWSSCYFYLRSLLLVFVNSYISSLIKDKETSPAKLVPYPTNVQLHSA